MNQNRRFTPEFCDRLIARLKAGEDPEKLRVELGIGAATMRHYIAFAKERTAA
jgi:hypothetical protein